MDNFIDTYKDKYALVQGRFGNCDSLFRCLLFPKAIDVASIIHYEFYQKIKHTIEMADQVHKLRTTGTIYMYPIYRI